MLQRNRNVQAVLEAKQSLESKKTNDAEKQLCPWKEIASAIRTSEPIAPQPKRKGRKKKKKKREDTGNTFITQ